MPQYRHEWKHEISLSDRAAIRQRLRLIARPDEHAADGRYQVRSLYFDNLANKALREKIDGVNRREKFRIRYYNGDASLIRLEKKSRLNGLGMVGALSIVRFRTAIKEPLDIAFLFWSIAVGIVLAAGMIPLAVIGSVVIGVILLVFVNKKSFENPYILVLQCSGQAAEAQAKAFLENNTKRCITKSKTVQQGMIELNLEVRLNSGDTDFVNALRSVSNGRDRYYKTVSLPGCLPFKVLTKNKVVRLQIFTRREVDISTSLLYDTEVESTTS